MAAGAGWRADGVQQAPQELTGTRSETRRDSAINRSAGLLLLSAVQRRERLEKH